MFDLPHFIWVILVIWAVWYGLRWFKRLLHDPGPQAAPRPGMGRDGRGGRRPNGRQGPPPRIEAEDLVACRVCGAYVAAGAPDCDRQGCPRPR